jgi:hypothetical protein
MICVNSSVFPNPFQVAVNTEPVITDENAGVLATTALRLIVDCDYDCNIFQSSTPSKKYQ